MKLESRWIIPILVIAAVAVGVAVSLMWETSMAPIDPPAPSSFDSQLTLRGARVVALGDCAVCHTAPGGKPYAGGQPLFTPFGTLYSTNITPDPATGIGAWSLEAFMRAMRRGIARDGHQLYPAFPYLHFSRMSDDDIAAAYATRSRAAFCSRQAGRSMNNCSSTRPAFAASTREPTRSCGSPPYPRRSMCI